MLWYRKLTEIQANLTGPWPPGGSHYHRQCRKPTYLYLL